MLSTPRSWKWPVALAASAMLLAGCQTVAQSSPTGVYKPRTASTARVYRTADGRVFRTRAERDAYLAGLERARQREIQATQSRRGVKVLTRAEERATRRAKALERERRELKRLERERRRAAIEAEALRQERKRLKRAERERRRAETAELARLQAEADLRAARRAQRQAERETARTGRSVQVGRDPDLAEREARRRARQAERNADQARRDERLARQEARIKEREREAREKRRQTRALPPRPRFVYDKYNGSLTKHRQRQAFYRQHRRPGETEAVFWSRPVF